LELGHHKRAILDFTKAIKFKKDKSPSYFHRGTVYKKLNNSDKAIKDFVAAVKLRPDFGLEIDDIDDKKIVAYAYNEYLRVWGNKDEIAVTVKSYIIELGYQPLY